MDRFEKMRGLVAALRAKAEDRAVSEAEALAFAEKASELMQRHGITLEDVQRSDDDDFVEEADLSTLRGRRHEVDIHGSVAIATFCDVEMFYRHTHHEGKFGWATVFFGYKPDVELAHFLRGTLMRASEAEWQACRSARNIDPLSGVIGVQF